MDQCANKNLRICVLDKDREFSENFRLYLCEKEAEVSVFNCDNDFIKRKSLDPFDFYIIDIAFAGDDSVDLIAAIRSQSPSGILVLSVHMWPDAFVSVMAAGANMVLTKPIRFDQVFHALQTIERRLQAGRNSAAPLGQWRMLGDASALVSPAGIPIVLTALEARVMECLWHANRNAVSRAMLAEAVRAEAEVDAGADGQQVVDATIFHLRRKIEQVAKVPPPIQTVHGVGYQLSAPLLVLPAS